MIAAAGQRGASRDKLLALLWPDSEPESARQGLYSTEALDIHSTESLHGAEGLHLIPSEARDLLTRFRLSRRRSLAPLGMRTVLGMTGRTRSPPLAPA